MAMGVLCSSHAFAEAPSDHTDPSEFEPVQNNALNILGSGLIDKETHESIALACLDDACHSIRFVYYKNPNEVYFFGETYQIESLNEKQVRSLIQQNIKGDRTITHFATRTIKSRRFVDWDHASWDEKETIAETVTEHDWNKHLLRTAGLIATLAGEVGLLFIAPVPGAILLGVTATGGSIWELHQDSKPIDYHHEEVETEETYIRNVTHKVRVTDFRRVTQQVFNQNGWNWVENPKSISHQKFEEIMTSLCAN